MFLILGMLGIIGLSHAGIAEEISAESAAFHKQFAQTDAKNVLPADLKKWLNSADPKIRLQALYYMDQKHPDALQVCQNLKNDPNEEIRKICLEVLILHLGQSAIPELFKRLPQETPANQLFILDFFDQKKMQIRNSPEILALLLQNLELSFQKQEKWRQEEEIASEDISGLLQTYSYLILSFPNELTRPNLLAAYESASTAYAFFLLELFQKLDFNLFLELLHQQLAKSPVPKELGIAMANFHLNWERNYPEDLLAPLVKLHFEQEFQIMHWIRVVLQEPRPVGEPSRAKTELYPHLKQYLQPYLSQPKHQDRLWEFVFLMKDPHFLPDLASRQLNHPHQQIRELAFRFLTDSKNPETEQQVHQLLNAQHEDIRKSALLWLINQKLNTSEMQQASINILKSNPNEIYGDILDYLWKNNFKETEKTYFSRAIEGDGHAIYRYWEFANQTQNADMFAKLLPILLRIKPDQNFLTLLKISPFETKSIIDYYLQDALNNKNQEMLSALLIAWKEKQISLPSTWIQSLNCTEATISLIQRVIEHPDLHQSQNLFQNCLQQAQTEVRQGLDLQAFDLVMDWPHLSESDKLKLLKQMPQPPANAKAVFESFLYWRLKLKDPSLKNEIKQRILAGTASTEELEFCADDVLLMDEAFFTKIKHKQLNTSSFLADQMDARDTEMNRQRLLEALPHMTEADLLSIDWLIEKWGDVRSLPVLRTRFQTESRQLKSKFLLLRAKLGDPQVLPDVLKALQSQDLLFRSAGLEAMGYLALSEQDLKPIENNLKQLEFDSLEKRDLHFYSAPAFIKLEESLKQFKVSHDSYSNRNWRDLVLSQSKGPDDSRIMRGLISRETTKEKNYIRNYGKVGAFDDFRLSADQPLIKAALMRGPRGILGDIKQLDPLIRLQTAIMSYHLPAPMQLPLLKTLSEQTNGQLKAIVNLARYIQGDESAKDFLHRYLVQHSNGYWGALLVAHTPPEQRLQLAQALIAQTSSEFAHMQIRSETGLSKEEQSRIQDSEKEEIITPDQLKAFDLLSEEIGKTSQLLKELTGDEKEFENLPQDLDSLNNLVWQLYFESELKLRKSNYDLDITTIARQERLRNKLKERRYDPRQADFEAKLNGQSLHITTSFRKDQFRLIKDIWGQKSALDWLKKLNQTELFVIPAYQYWVQTQLLPGPTSADYFSHLAQIEATVKRFGSQDKKSYPFAKLSLSHLKAAAYFYQKNTQKIEQALGEMGVEFKRLPSHSRFDINYGIWQAIYHKWQGLLAEQKGNFTLAEEEWLWSLWWVGYVYHDSSNYSWESWDPLFQPQHTRHLLRSHKKIPSQNRQWYERYFGRDFSQVDDALKPLLLTDK